MSNRTARFLLCVFGYHYYQLERGNYGYIFYVEIQLQSEGIWFYMPTLSFNAA